MAIYPTCRQSRYSGYGHGSDYVHTDDRNRHFQRGCWPDPWERYREVSGFCKITVHNKDVMDIQIVFNVDMWLSHIYK